MGNSWLSYHAGLLMVIHKCEKYISARASSPTPTLLISHSLLFISILFVCHVIVNLEAEPFFFITFWCFSSGDLLVASPSITEQIYLAMKVTRIVKDVL